MAPNVFLALQGYSTHSAENYLTECFAFLLRHLLAHDPIAGLGMINRLCGFDDVAAVADRDGLAVSTQVHTEAGIPDLVIRSPSHCAFVEIKVGAPLGPGQLEAYARALGNEREVHQRLVLLTRSRAAAEATALDSGAYHHICWYEIDRWLAKAGTTDGAGHHFVTAFREFLEVKGMSMNRVGWAYIDGVPALNHLIDMLWAVVREAMPGARLKASAGSSWRGITVDTVYYIGVRYDRPLIVAFDEYDGKAVVFKRDFDLEASHFFALPAEAQFEALVQFVRQAAAEAMDAPAAAS